MSRVSEKSYRQTETIQTPPSREMAEHPAPGPRTGRFWPWFGAVFAVVVLVGSSILYVTATSPSVDDEPPTAPEPEVGDVAAEPASQEPPAGTMVMADNQTSAVLLSSFVVDSFGFHAMEESYAEATEIGERDAGQIAKVLAALDATDWPDELTGPVAVLRSDMARLIAALEANDLDGARAGFAAVHGSQHDFSNGVYDWLATATPDGSTSAVLLSSFVVDSFGFHAMEESYAEATEIGERDAGQIAKVLAALDATDWPDELTGPVAVLRSDMAGLIAALEANDLDGARAGFAAVHGSQHDFSNGVYAWLRGDPVEGHGGGEPATTGGAAAVIEIEMTEFAYAPESIQLQAGVPVILRFTNSGKLLHEAMVGDAHMQEEWASAAGGNHDPTDGHHGDLMAVTVEPGQTQDLEVVIDEPGTWYMACHITGHYEQGQVATINVA